MFTRNRAAAQPEGPITEVTIKPHEYVDDPRTPQSVTGDQRKCIMCGKSPTFDAHTSRSDLRREELKAALGGSLRRMVGAAAMPWYVGGGMVVAGAAVSQQPLAALGGPVVAVALTKLLPSKWLSPRGEVDEETVAKRRRTVGWCSGAGCVWLAAAAVFGVDPHTAGGAATLAALIPTTGLAGIPFWGWRRRKPAKPTDPAVQVEEPNPEFGALIATTWLETVGAQGGALPGSWLENIHRVPGGWGGDAVGPNGKFAPAMFRGALPRIASSYGVGVVSVSVIPNSSNAGRAKVLSQPRSPLVRPRVWTGGGIDVATGLAAVSTLTDGTRASHQFWQPGWGPRHELVVGDSGSGKSEYLNLLLGLEHDSDRILSWVGDPQMGQTMGRTMRNSVDWFAPGHDEIMLMLRTVRRLILGRNIMLARMSGVPVDVVGLSGDDFADEDEVRYLDPDPNFPLVVVSIDEAYIPMDDREAVKLLAFIAKSGRKCNVKLRLVLQSPLLSELKDSVLRSQLRAGLVTMFRLAEPISSAAAWPGKLPFDPAELPATWDETGETTAGLGFQSLQPPMLLRTDYPDPATLRRIMRSPKLNVLEDSILPVLGDAYAKRQERLADFDATDAEKLLAQLDADDDEPIEEQQSKVTVLLGSQKEDPNGRKKVLAVLAHGRPMQHKEIGESLGTALSTRQMTNVLKKLTKEKAVTNHGGTYQLVQKADAERVSAA